MKKILFTIVLFIICPIIALGKDFAIKDYGITMSFDKNWDVFTRKSTKDDIFLLKYNLDYDLLQKNLKDNLIYLYAICEINDNSNIEFLFTTTGEKVVITEEEFEMFASLLIEKYDAENYEIYESNYEYIKYDYFNSSVDLYCVDYFLYIDSIGYFFTFRKEEPFTDDEISQVENVINSITVSGDGIQYVEGASNDDGATGTELSERKEFIIDFVVKFVLGAIAFTILAKTILNKDYIKKKFFSKINKK